MSRTNRVIKQSYLELGRPDDVPAVAMQNVSSAFYGVKINTKTEAKDDTTFANASKAEAKGLGDNTLEVSIRSTPGSELYWLLFDEKEQDNDTRFIYRPRNAPASPDNPEYRGYLCINDMPGTGGNSGDHAWEGSATWRINGEIEVWDGANTRYISKAG